MRIDNPTFVGDENKFNGQFTGSFQGTGSALTGVPFDGLSNKPELISSSNQISSDISGSLGPNGTFIRTLTESGISGSSNSLSASLAVRVRNVEERSVDGFPFTGSANITGSMNVVGPVTASYFVGDGTYITNVAPENYQNIVLTVVSNKYQIDNELAPRLTFIRGVKYRFDTSDPSCEFHTVSFLDNKNSVYTENVTTVGTAGSAGSYTEILVSFNAPTFLKYRSNAGGQSYGNSISVFDNFNPVFPEGAEFTGSISVTERIGVGVTIPQYQVHIQSAGDASLVINADTDDSNENDNPMVRLTQDGGTKIGQIGINGLATPYTDAISDALYFGTTTADPFQILSNNAARMSFLSNGRVGVKTTSPTADFQVNGIVSASTFYGDGSNLTGISGSGGSGVTKLNDLSDVMVTGSGHNPEHKYLLFYSDNESTPHWMPGRWTFNDLFDIPSGIVSSSLQIQNQGFITSSIATNFPQNTVSSSAQVIAFLPEGVVSSSAQIEIPATDFSQSFQNIVVTQSSLQYYVDGVVKPKITLQKGHTYRFDLSDSSNSGHPFAFRLRDGSTAYTDGVTQVGTAGTSGAYTQIHVKQDAPTKLIYYCTVHGNSMGNSIIVQSAFNTAFEDNMSITGSLSVTGNVSAANISDERVKDNLIPISQPLDKLGEIQGYEFDWIPTEGVTTEKGHDLGVVAQEIEKIAPEAVVTRENGYKSVKYDRLIPILIQSIKELTERVKVLENK